MEYIKILDTTLRDGEQTPGVSFTSEEKEEVAIKLDELGVDIIEAGFPTASKGEETAFKNLANAGLKAELCALTRTLKSDIDFALRYDVDSIHTFISTSEVQLKYALNMTHDQVLRAVTAAIHQIKNHGCICEFSPMDATRTKEDFLKRVCIVAQEAGADRINIADTVGIMTPSSMKRLISTLKTVVKIPLSVHCHNDFGMAVANSLAGVESGASQVHVTVNGIGERAGNAALEEVVLALHLLYGKKTRINTRQLYTISKLVSRLTGVVVQPNKAIVGENAFAHESGIHTKGVTFKPVTFEPFNPEFVGRRRKLAPGKLAGRHGLIAELKEAGINPDEEQMREIIKRIKDLGDKGKIVTDADLFAVANAVMGLSEKKIIELSDLAVVTGTGVIPTASLKLKLDEKEYVASETGLGPVDAAIKALQKLTDNLVNVKLIEYRLEAATGGSDAIAEVIIKVEDNEGNVVSARGAREDIVIASVETMVNGINKLLLKKRKKG